MVSVVYHSAMDESSLKTAQLLAIQKHIATKCASVNRAWLECKDKHQDPKHCTEIGKQVLKCTNDLCASESGVDLALT